MAEAGGHNRGIELAALDASASSSFAAASTHHVSAGVSESNSSADDPGIPDAVVDVKAYARKPLGASFSAQFGAVMKKNFLMLRRIRSIVVNDVLWTLILASVLLIFGFISTVEQTPAFLELDNNTSSVELFASFEDFCKDDYCAGKTLAFSDAASPEPCSSVLAAAVNGSSQYLNRTCSRLLAQNGISCECISPDNYNVTKVLMGLSFAKALPAPGSDAGAVNYTIHAPAAAKSVLDAPRFSPFSFWGPSGPSSPGEIVYITFLQVVADELLISLRSSEPEFLLNVSTTSMPYNAQEFEGPAFETSQALLMFYPMLLLAMGGVGVAGVIMKEREQKLDAFLFVAGIRETVYWLSWAAYGLFRLMLSLVLLIVLILALPHLFPEGVETSPLAIEALFTGLALVVYTMLLGATTDSVGFVNATFIILLEIQGGIAFLWHFDVVPAASESSVGPVLAYLFSIFSAPFAMGLFTSTLFRGPLEWGYGDYGWQSIVLQTPYGISPLDIMICTVANIILLALGAVYLHHTIPNAGGTQKPPCFCWQLCKSKPRKSSEDREKDIETNFSDRNVPIVSIRGLKKSFGRGASTCKAVDNLDLDFFQGEVCAFLGHNGCGKTTTLNMITGVVHPDDGVCRVAGTSTQSSGGLGYIRSITGVCTQHDLQYPFLTVRENLELVARLRCVDTESPASQMNELLATEVNNALAELQLLGKADEQAQHLSGGQKRRLTVALALVGSPRLLLLDEPTANLDTSARHAVWGMIRERRKMGCAVVLTTHHMDEAEVLGDRVVVMSKGHVQTQGTAVQLKEKLGIGYKLTMSVESAADFDAVVQKLRGSAESTAASCASQLDMKEKTESAPRTSLTCSVPPGEAASVAAVLNALKSDGTDIQFAFMSPSLADVFIRLCENAEAAASTQSAQHSPGAQPMPHAAHTTATVHAEPRSHLDIAKDISAVIELERQPVTSCQQIAALVAEKFQLAQKRPSTLLPTVILAIGLAAVCALAFADLSPPERDAAVDLHPTAILSGTSAAPELIVGWDAPSTAKTPLRTLLTSPLVDVPLPVNGSGSGVAAFSDLVNTSNAAAAVSVSAASAGFDMLLATNGSVLFGNVAAITVCNSAILCLAGGVGGNGGEDCPLIGVSLALLPESESEQAYQQVFDQVLKATVSGLILSFLMVLALPAQLTPVLEEQVKMIKQVKLLTGIEPSAYWGAQLLFDTTILCIPFFVFTIIIASSDVEWLVGMSGFAFFLVFVLGVACTMSLFYLLGRNAKIEDPNAGQTKVLLPFMLTYFLFEVPFIVPQFLADIEPAVQAALQTVAMVHPAVALSGTMTSIVFNSAVPRIPSFHEPQHPFAWDIASRGVLFLAVEFAIFFGVLLHLESNHVMSRDPYRTGCCGAKAKEVDFPDIEDMDVKAERQRIDADDDGNHSRQNGVQPILRFNHVKKVFPPQKRNAPVNVAVADLCLDIHEGECFGLLGTNGAGKTTALSMMLGNMSTSSGSIFARGQLVGRSKRSHGTHLFEGFGYCPQTNVFIPEFTARETLESYARLHGAKNPKAFAELWLHIMYLGPFADQPASTYSGGNKRKLCLAIALCGLPDICVLDEPSAGVDTKARADLWAVLKALQVVPHGPAHRKTTLVLTTHYMSEAEELSTRIGLMVRGQMTCLGSPQHLANLYASNYLLSFEVHGEAEALGRAMQRLLQLFPQSTENIEYSAHTNKGCIVLHESTVVADAFSVMEREKSNLGVSYFTIGQQSMEQVFLNFARKEEELTRAHDEHFLKEVAHKQTSKHQ